MDGEILVKIILDENHPKYYYNNKFGYINSNKKLKDNLVEIIIYNTEKLETETIFLENKFLKIFDEFEISNNKKHYIEL